MGPNLLLRRRAMVGGGGKDWSKEPLTFEILSSGNITWKIGSGSTARAIEYSKNGGAWTSITSTSVGADISVVAGDKLRFRGNTWPGSAQSNYSNFASTCSFKVNGNPASLMYGETLIGGEPLADYCFFMLFRGCTGLTAAPELPATSLASNCYRGMFYGCTGLTAAPELPSTTLARACYLDMFRGCTGLTAAPELPATTMAEECYQYMFRGCTGLTAAPELPATTLASICYHSMFYGCTGLTAAPELPATSLASNCYNSMFYGCTGLTAAPELPATSLASNCYNSMFYGCSHLSFIICLATSISPSNALTDWVRNVREQGTFRKAAGVSWPFGNSGIPNGWTVIEV